MNIRFTSAAVAALIVAWAPHGLAQRQAVVLPGAVNATGELNGVDTTGDAILSVGNQNINTSNNAGGAFTTSANATGEIVFGGNSTVTGATGQTGTAFRSISAGANGTTVTFNGAVFLRPTGPFNVTGTGTVNFNGDINPGITGTSIVYAADGFINLGAGRSMTAAITTLAANIGTLTLNGASSVVGAVSGLKQINVAGGNASITGAVGAQGFSLGTNTLTITGALTPSAGATFATSLANNALFGNINVLGASNVTSPVTVVPTVSGLLTVGTTYLIVNGTSGGTVGTAVNVVNNSPLYTFVGVPVNIEGDVRITLVAAVPLAAPAAGVLGAPAAPGSDLAAIQNAILALPSLAAVNNALAQLAPGTTNLAAPWVAGQVTRQFEDLWMARVEEIQDLCCDSCDPNRSANTHKCKGPENRGNWWGKGFGREGRQGDVDNTNGYKTRGYGLMLAYDAPLNDQTRAGVGIGYARNSIDGNNTSGSTDIDSYQATAYLGYTPGPWFVQGALTAGVDRYNGARAIVFPGVNRSAAAGYSGHQIGGLVAVGTHLYNNRGFTVTPLASLQYSRVHVGSYAESGAGDVNLRVNNQDYDFVQSALGVKAERVMRAGASTYSPEVHFKWFHDFNSTTMQQNAAFAGGGAVFTAQGVQQNRELFNLGAGVTVLSCACDKTATWTVKGLYDYKWNQSHYSSHQVSLILSAKF